MSFSKFFSLFIKRKPSRKLLLIILIVSWLFLVGFYHTHKDLPEGVSFTGTVYEVPASAIKVFTDNTFIDRDGKYRSEQEIFNEIIRMIDNSTEYVLVDMFLFNDFLGTATSSYRSLSNELVQALVAKKSDNPDMTIQLITDPINKIYGGFASPQLKKLEDAGVEIIITNLKPLRDSNPVYSSLWRTFGQWWGNSSRTGYLPNPFAQDGQKLSVRTYLSLLNFKANHRKVIVADYIQDGQYKMSTLITSANPHDGSSRHSNFAIRVDTEIWRDVLLTERAVADFSGGDFIPPHTEVVTVESEASSSSLEVQLLTEKVIKNQIIEHIDSLEEGDTVDIAMFYLADREVIQSFKRADDRGVRLRLLLDPNKDAFGREKNGLPNRQVAHELVAGSEGNTEIRWCATHGEQCHSKLIFINKSNEAILIQGSANLTRRNIDDFNLETNVLIKGQPNHDVFVETKTFFNEQWTNEDGRLYSYPYEEYSDDSIVKTIQYRFMEWSGLSSW